MPGNKSGNIDPESARIGETLRTIRQIRGFKVAELANELDISYSYLSNIEAGRKRLTPQLLARAARILDVDQVAIVREGYFESRAETQGSFRAAAGATR